MRLSQSLWHGLWAPTDTPAAAIDRLNVAINEFLRSPQIEASLAKFNAKPKIGSPQDFAKFWRDETEKWTNVVTSAGIKDD